MSSWPLSNTSAQRRLERLFRNRGIDFLEPGFCDSPPFLRAERSDPRFLETYASFVEARAYDHTYLCAARQKIEIVTETVREAVANDGRLGACIDASGMIGRMLDRLHIWNYIAQVCLTIAFDAAELEPTHFWALDERKFAVPHAIVVAPPFTVIDVTIKYQSHAPEKQSIMPQAVVSEQFDPAKWDLDDIANPRFQGAVPPAGIPCREQQLERAYPTMFEVIAALPPRLVQARGIAFKYVPVAVAAFNEQLEDMKGYKPGGRTALEIFEADVLPRLPTQR